MPLLRVTITLEVDGNPLSISPITRAIDVTEESLAQFVQAADSGSTYHQVQNATQPILQAFFFTADQNWNLKFNNSGALAMTADGLVLILNSNLTAGAATNAVVNIPGTTNANVSSLTGGT